MESFVCEILSNAIECCLRDSLGQNSQVDVPFFAHHSFLQSPHFHKDITGGLPAGHLMVKQFNDLLAVE